MSFKNRLMRFMVWNMRWMTRYLPRVLMDISAGEGRVAIPGSGAAAPVNQR